MPVNYAGSMPGHAGYAGEVCREYAGACRGMPGAMPGTCRGMPGHAGSYAGNMPGHAGYAGCPLISANPTDLVFGCS